MKNMKKVVSSVLVMTLILTMSITAFAASGEKKIAIYGSKDGQITVSNVTSEKKIGSEVVYYATSPVRVTFTGSDLGREMVYYLPSAKVGANSIESDGTYTDVNFEVAQYKYYDDDTIYDVTKQPVEDECTYVSGNYAVLKEAGVYSVTASPAALAGTSFYIVVSSETAPVSTPSVAATPTASNVMVNGTKVAFDAYNIDGNNYFKLRDIAKVISGTQKQFEVTWDNDAKAINLVSGKAYTPVGGEMKNGAKSKVNATPNTSTIYKDKEVVKLTAYTINGNNYFKLRDLGQAFNFGVTWDAETNTIKIDTSTGYMNDTGNGSGSSTPKSNPTKDLGDTPAPKEHVLPGGSTSMRNFDPNDAGNSIDWMSGVERTEIE